jgi:hypothetical protein
MQQIASAHILAFGLRRETYERIAIGLITLALLAFLPANYFFLAFVMLGQGHFLMTYLYQWKAGKIGTRYMIAYAVALTVLAVLAAYFLPLPFLLLITGSVFALHFFYDEARLHARDNGISLGLVWYPAFLFFLVLVKILYTVDLLPAIVIGTLLFVLQSARSQTVPASHASTAMYMHIFSAILLFLLIFPIAIPATAVLGAIILYHYMSWYVHYFFRLRDGGRPLRPYIKNGILVNALVISSFAAFLVLAPGYAKNAFSFFFAEQYFYMWTLLHIFFASNEFMVAVRTLVLRRTVPSVA